ncbi:hypothetical protein [Halodesulfovibrio aestuarii]|uniref:Large polyvalent protein associated domain-containing protein n=1 Tax=Halodesulfovibrio aestuarii TaxID=126333 RepID=A0ABV4JR19_9BACT
MHEFDFTAAVDAPEQTSLMPQASSVDDIAEYDFSAAVDAPPFLPTPILQELMKKNPDLVARSQKLARKMELPQSVAENAYPELEKQDAAERFLFDLQRTGTKTQQFMSVSENAAIAHDDVLELGEIEESGSAFKALLRSGGRAPFSLAKFGNQAMAYFYGAMDSASKGMEQLTGFKRGGMFEQGEKYWLTQSKYIDDEWLNSGSLAIPERLQKSLWDNPQLLMNPEYLVTQVGEAASSMLPMVAAYVATGGSLAVPAVIGGLQEAASLYEDLVRDGVDQASAGTAATSFGVVVGMLDKIGLGEITKKIATKSIMHNLARRAVGGAAEGFTEYMEEPFQAAFSALAKGKDMDGVVADVAASLKNVDVIPGAFLLGAGITTHVDKAADRVAGIVADVEHGKENANHLRRLSAAVANSKLAERSNKVIGDFVDSVLPESAKEQFVDAKQFATLFQDAVEEGQDVSSVEEVLSRLEVSPEAFQEALQKDTVIPLSVSKLMQSCTKDERELLIPHLKADPLAMSEAESAQHDLRGEAYRIFSEYSQDEEHTAALEGERVRIRDGLIKQGVHESEADAMAAIPHAFAQSYGTYGLDGVDFLRRFHVGEVTPQGVETDLFQAMRRSEAASFQEFIAESRGGGNSQQIYFDAKANPEALSKALGANELRVNLPSVFIAHLDKQRKNQTEALVAKVDDVFQNATFVGKVKGGRGHGTRFVAILEEGEKATAVVFDLAKRKTMHIARPVTAFSNGKDKVRAHFREAIPIKGDSIVHGMNTLTSDSISEAANEGNTDLKQNQRGSLSFLPENNYLIKLAATADRSTFVHECAHVFLAEMSRMTGQTQVFDQNVSSPKLDDLAAEQEMLGEAMNAGLEDSLSAINPEGKPYVEAHPEWAKKEEGYRTATIQKDFDEALYDNDAAYDEEKAKLAHVIKSDTAAEIPQQLLKDMEVLRKWMNLKKGEAISTEHHEQFARGFEAYLREGKAPSLELAQVFHRFRTWLLSIYKNAKSLHVNLNNEVRDVFDRMLATNEQVADAMYINEMVEMERARLEELTEANEQDRATLEREMNETEREAISAMDRATLRDRNKRWKKANKDARGVVEDEPVYKAVLWMSKRKGLDEAYMLHEYGEDTVKELRQKHRGLIKKNGQAADDAATEHNFEDSHHMVEAMVDAPSFKERVKQVAQEFFAYEEAQTNPEEIVLAGEAYGRYLEKYNAMLSKRIRSKTYSPRDYLRRFVKEQSGATKIREAMRYDGHQHTMRKHSKLREEAAAKRDANAEAFHLEKLRLAYEFVGEAIRVREEVQKIASRVKQYAKNKSGLDYHYRDHIRAIGQRFGLVGKSLYPVTPEHMSSLKTLLASQEDVSGVPPSFPDWLVEGTEPIDWKDLTVDEFRMVNDLIQHLNHEGRETRKENKAVSKEQIDNAATAGSEGAQKTTRKLYEKGTLKRKLMDVKDSVLASLDTLQYLLATFDAVNDTGKDGERGVNVRLLFDLLVGAQNEKARKWTEMQAKIKPAMLHLRKTARKWEKQHGKSFSRIKLNAELRDGIHKELKGQIKEGANTSLGDETFLELAVPDIMQQDGRKWTPDAILGLMFHTGTKSNLERVFAGYPELKEGQTFAYLKSMLTHKDWDAIQQMWDAIDSLYPELDAVHKRQNGFHMTKIEAQAFGIERGGKIKKYAGGYFPAIYDSTLPQTQFVKQYTEHEDLISRAEAINQTPAARSGFTQGRKNKAPGFPLKLSVNVAVEHLYETIHYTTHAEALRFIDRVTKHEKWEKAFKQVMGEAAYDAVRGHLKAIARPERPVRDVWQRIGENLRTAATPFILGWNFGVAAKQVFSLPGGVHDIGMKDFCKGLKTVMSTNPREQMKRIHEMSPFMRDRVNSMDRELGDLAKKFRTDVRTIEVFGKELSQQDAIDLGFWPIRIADIATTYVLWVSSYEKAMRQGKDMEQAVLYADDIIRKSQPSSQAIDQTMWQRHQGAMRMLSMFQTYTVRTFGARQRHHYRAMKAGKMSKVEYAKYVLYDQIFPPIAMQLAFALMWGNAPDPDDDDGVVDFLMDMGAGVAGYQFAGIPLVSGVFSSFDAMQTPAATGLDLVQRSLRQGWKFFENPDETQTEKMLWSLFHLGSYATRIPASQVARRFKKGMEQLESGEGTIINPLIPEHKK